MSKKDKKKRTDSMEDKKKNETRQSTMQNRMENMNGQKPKTISIVISVYNEEKALHEFYREATPVFEALPWNYEPIFVNDGSADASGQILAELAAADPRVRVINFSRNFGHEAAMLAGLDHSIGEGIVCMDADLQHPPESIPAIIEKFEEGYEVISMIRTKNEGAGVIKKITSAAFYRVLNMMSPVKFENNSSDFFAISKNVAEVLRQDYREKVRYLRGYVQSVGFKKTTLEFEARDREAGESKYSIRKLMHFSINALCSFSDLPLKLGIYSGIFVALCGVILMIYTIVNKFVYGAPGGYSTIIVALCFMFAITLIIIGIIGEYISILFAEIKDRPIYIVHNVLNDDKAEKEEDTH